MDKNKFKSLKNKALNNYKNKGNNFVGILKAPEKTEWFKPNKGRNVIDIIPYEITTDNHPDVKNKISKIGDFDYVLSVWVHRFVGVEKGTYLCLNKNYHKPCPICEEYEKLKQSDSDKEEINKLKPARRVVYNILDHKDNKLKLFEVSYFQFEKELLDEAGSGDDGELVDFYNPIDGRSVSFRAVENTQFSTKNPFFDFKSFQFEKREDEISEKIINSALSLDSLLNILSYDDLYSQLYDIEDNKEENTSSKVKSKKTEDDEDQEEYQEEEEEEQPKKKKNQKELDEEYVKEIEESENKTKKTERKRETKTCQKCPSGHQFGIDAENTDDCNNCDQDIWNACLDKRDEEA